MEPGHNTNVYGGAGNKRKRVQISATISKDETAEEPKRLKTAYIALKQREISLDFGKVYKPKIDTTNAVQIKRVMAGLVIDTTAAPKQKTSFYEKDFKELLEPAPVSPNIKSLSWSAGDDTILMQARAQGLNWMQIASKHLPAKSPNACRKRHERLMERQNEHWDGVKLDVLAQAYMEVRRDMWKLLAARVGEKWQLVEQKCMEKGLKNLEQVYRSAPKKDVTHGFSADF